jgi:hypothetical protein
VAETHSGSFRRDNNLEVLLLRIISFGLICLRPLLAKVGIAPQLSSGQLLPNNSSVTLPFDAILEPTGSKATAFTSCGR